MRSNVHSHHLLFHTAVGIICESIDGEVKFRFNELGVLYPNVHSAGLIPISQRRNIRNVTIPNYFLNRRH
ncbi:MAG: hypothetical protein C4527_20645 [Candidatus Omnitrophota bacterium]|jgi:hypothetical protein|nr:MAG: hypothetical protein C4527_20645 [Candidatus Omnitrophota bacterium]